MTIDLEKVYHVRAVTQTDVVRAGTKEVAKIFQLLYDVEAVSGPGCSTYLGAVNDSSAIGNKSKANNDNNTTSNMLSSTLANATLGSNATLLHNNDMTFSESGIGGSSRGYSTDDYTTISGSDAISVGSNDSGDVRIQISPQYSLTHYLHLCIYRNTRMVNCI